MALRDPQNVKMGVCYVAFAGSDLGFTKGGVEMEVQTETYQVTVDQFGNTPVSERIIGRTCSVTTPLAETTLDNLVAVIPGATKVVDGTSSEEKAEVITGIGTDLLAIADELILHPIDKATSDKSEDVTVPKAATPGSMSWSYQHDSERVFDVTWTAYPDTANGDLLFVVGDTGVTA